jgi:hypothetical protein
MSQSTPLTMPVVWTTLADAGAATNAANVTVAPTRSA